MALSTDTRRSGKYVGLSYEDVFRLLEERIITLESCMAQEKALRDKHPALKDLYDQYQAVKKLVHDV